jgi:glycerate kinase
MHVTVALDKFKGTFSSAQAAELLVQGFKKRQPNITAHVHPLADGGEGTAQILANRLGMDVLQVACVDLLGRPINAPLYWSNSERIALVESASVLGSHLAAPTSETFFHSNSRGLGQLFLHALSLRPKEIWIGLGGTLTADAGWGFASVCGLEARDQAATVLTPSIQGIPHIADLVLRPAPLNNLSDTKVFLLCDVNAPAAPVFDVSLASFLPQKGAPSGELKATLEHLGSFARALMQISPSTRKFSDSFTAAAGGMALGISAVLPHVHCIEGAHHVARLSDLEGTLAGTDLVICGEGKLDTQTLFGKTPMAVAELALKNKIPLIGVFGIIEGDSESLRKKLNAERLFSLFHRPPDNWRQLKRESESRLIELGVEIAHLLLRG